MMKMKKESVRERERNMNKSITGGIVARETIVKERERERESVAQ